MSEKTNPSRHRRRQPRSPNPPDMSQDNQSVPEQKSEGLAEKVIKYQESWAIDTNNREQGGTNMQGNRFTEFFREHKGVILQGLVVVAIAVVVSIVVVMQFAPDKGLVTQYMSDTDQALEAASAHITTLTQEVNDIQAMDLVGSADLVPITDQAAATSANVTALGTRVSQTEADIQVHAGQLANMHASPPECYLSGNLTAGNLTLHAWASEAGNYTANVYLVFSGVSVGNTTQNDAVTAFYGSVNWTTANRAYVPTVTFNGTDWHVSDVAFSIGTFELTANNETATPVLFGGLNYTADFAYAEIYRVVE